MDSPATPKTPRSRPRSHRKPLQPKNLNSIPQPETLPKPKPIFAGVDAGKENRREASLAEELEAARRRRERLRAERERTEEALTARDATMAAAIRAMERRAEEQRRLESELRRLIGLAELRSSCMRSCSVQSLRAREEERRKRDAEPQEPSSLVVDKEVATPSKAREEEIET
ncbi:high mobility group B protein 6-like [Ananas comosus]|uniref:High mobility group B protein 6-like n=1 Tax=Ananas comosus TaxID=4615 RepID=A0A6P5EUR8_ANACO|nr:high mobility group B protein 6-like [Ananas comosus]